MFKIFGILLLSSIPIALGLKKSRNLIQQKREVAGLIGLVTRCRQNIAYQQLPLADLIQQLPKQQCKIVDRLIEYMQNDTSPVQAWREVAIDLHYSPILSIMDDYFSALGASDQDSQLKICDMTSARLEEIRMKLETEIPAKAKLYRTVGILAGTFIAILLI